MKSLSATRRIFLDKLDWERSAIRVYLSEFVGKPLIWLFNICLAAFAFAIALPTIAAIAVLIKLDSPGPAIFKQTRVGMNRRTYKERRKKTVQNVEMHGSEEKRKENLLGRPFTFYKFRTMKVNARELYPELYTYQYTEEQIEHIRFKIENDPRVTRFGKWLRKTSLDELPNFINVLKGDMYLVGPRPEIPEMSKYYLGKQTQKYSVKPGVTGLAQINGRGRLKFQKTIEYDLDYVGSKSFLLDLKIILKTIYVMLRGHGAF